MPYRFSLWASAAYLHVKDLNDEWTDTQIWEYARNLQLTIITKDADFSDRMLLSQPPPRVIHLKLGNLKMRELHTTLTQIWPDVCLLSEQYKLVRIFTDRIGGFN